MVRHYFPQSANGEVATNSNFPPQSGAENTSSPVGGTMEYEDFVGMEYEDNDDMDYESGAGIPANWFDTAWTRRILITVNSGQVAASETDFPFLFNSTVPDLPTHVQVGGEDIRFVNFDGDIVFSYELQEVEASSGLVIAHIKLPIINDGQKLYMYYNNPLATDGQNVADVWSNNYLAVYHMNEAGTTLNDSTGNGHDATLVSGGTNADLAPGKIGDGKNFLGLNALSFYLVSSNLEFTNNNKSSISAWASVDFASSATNARGIMAQMGGQPSAVLGFTFGAQDQATYKFLPMGGPWERPVKTPSGVTDGIIRYWTGTFDGSDIKLYFNALQVAILSTTKTMNLSFDDWHIGTNWANVPATNEMWQGIIQEVRVSDIPRSTDWITTEYNNQNDPDIFYEIKGPTIIFP